MTSTVIDLAKELVAALDQAAEVKQDPKFIVEAEFTDLPEKDVKKLLADYHRLEKLFKARKEALEVQKQKIIDAMHGAENLRIEETGQVVAEYRVVTGTITDTTRLKKELPDVAAEYTKLRTQRPFKLLV